MMTIIRRFLFICMVICTLVLGLLIYWQYKHPTYELSRVVKPIKNEEFSKHTPSDVSYDASDVLEISSVDELRADSKLDEPIYLKSHLKIPQIGVDVKIYEGLGKKALSYGAGTIREGMNPKKAGVYAIAAHNLHDFDSGSGFSKFQKYRKEVIGKTAYLSDGENVYIYKLIDNVSTVKTDSMKYTDDDYVNQLYSDYIVKYPSYATKVQTKKEFYEDGNYKELESEVIKTYKPFISFYTCDVQKEGGRWISFNRILTVGILIDIIPFNNTSKDIRELFLESGTINYTDTRDIILNEEESVSYEEPSHIETEITREEYTGNNLVFNFINKQVSKNVDFVNNGIYLSFILFGVFTVLYIFSQFIEYE